MSESRVIDAALRRGVRAELVVAPLSLLFVTAVSVTFVALGLERDAPHFIALGVVIFASNTVFGLLSVRSALRYLRETGPEIVVHRRKTGGEGQEPGGGGEEGRGAGSAGEAGRHKD